MTRTRTRLIYGLAIVLVVGAGWAFFRPESSSGRSLTATLIDAGALEPGNEVRASGVQVGTISNIALVGGKAKVTMELDDGVLPVHQDATLVVRPVNLLGENYVDLNPGTSNKPFLSSNAIPEAQTKAEVTLQDVLNTFKGPTAASLAAVVTTLGEGFRGNGGEVAAALKALAPAMTNADELGDLLRSQNDVLSGLVGKLDPVAGAVAVDQGQTLDRLVSATNDLLGAVASDQQALDATLAQLPATLSSAQRTLKQLAGISDSTTPTLQAIRPITDNLTEVTAEIQRFADAADPALASLRPVLEHADALLAEAAPVVAELENAGPALNRAARSARPVGNELLDKHLGDVMGFVRKWALSTNGRDGLSHYFRGVFYVTPTTLRNVAKSLVPTALTQTKSGPKESKPAKGKDLLGSLGLGGLGDALGLNAAQENDLLGQLLGGVLK